MKYKKSQLKTRKIKDFCALIVSKKSQLKMMENMAIMFIFFILIVIGFVFYMNMQKTSIKASSERFSQLEAMKIAQRIAFLPEVRCSEQNVPEADCYDYFKLKKAGELMTAAENVPYYSSLLGYSGADVVIIYPHEENIPLYNKDYGDVEFSASATDVPITVKNAGNDTYYFAVLRIRTYKRAG